MAGKRREKRLHQPKDGRQPYWAFKEVNDDDGLSQEKARTLRENSGNLAGEISSSQRVFHGEVSQDQIDYFNDNRHRYELAISRIVDFAEAGCELNPDRVEIIKKSDPEKGKPGEIEFLIDFHDEATREIYKQFREYLWGDEGEHASSEQEHEKLNEIATTHLWNAAVAIDSPNMVYDNFEDFHDDFVQTLQDERNDKRELFSGFSFNDGQGGMSFYKRRVITPDDDLDEMDAVYRYEQEDRLKDEGGYIPYGE